MASMRPSIFFSLLALFALPFCLCQDEQAEVRRRTIKPVARIVGSHQQRMGSNVPTREVVGERNLLVETFSISTSTDEVLMKQEVDDLEQTSHRVQVLCIYVLSILFHLYRHFAKKKHALFFSLL